MRGRWGLIAHRRPDGGHSAVEVRVGGELVQRMRRRLHRQRRARRERERRGSLARGAIARRVMVVAGRCRDVKDVVGRRGPVVVVRAHWALCRTFMRRWMGIRDETGELIGEVHIAAWTRAVVAARRGEFSKGLWHGEVRGRGDEEVVGVEAGGAVGGCAVAARGRRGRGGREVEAFLTMGLVVGVDGRGHRLGRA